MPAVWPWSKLPSRQEWIWKPVKQRTRAAGEEERNAELTKSSLSLRAEFG